MPRLPIGTGKVGIASPFSSNGRGGFARASGHEQLVKLIRENLQDCDSDNPFQGDIGLSNQHIFELDGDEACSELRIRIKSLFKRLSLDNRAELTGPIKFSSSDGELVAEVNYMDIEENKPSTLTISKASGGQLTIS